MRSYDNRFIDWTRRSCRHERTNAWYEISPTARDSAYDYQIPTKVAGTISGAP